MDNQNGKVLSSLIIVILLSVIGVLSYMQFYKPNQSTMNLQKASAYFDAIEAEEKADLAEKNQKIAQDQARISKEKQIAAENIAANERSKRIRAEQKAENARSQANSARASQDYSKSQYKFKEFEYCNNSSDSTFCSVVCENGYGSTSKKTVTTANNGIWCATGVRCEQDRYTVATSVCNNL